MLQLADFLFFQKLKLLESLAFGEQWLVMEHLSQFCSGFHGRLFLRVDGEIDKSFPNVAYGLFGGMHHVFLVETIVAQLIQEDFVGGEIMGIVKCLTNLIHSQKKSRFTQLVLMQAVLQVAQRRNGEDKLLFRMSRDYF